jgi:pyroglutamyl-peptidase
MSRDAGDGRSSSSPLVGEGRGGGSGGCGATAPHSPTPTPDPSPQGPQGGGEKPTTRTILITGFGRFPGSPFNASGPVAIRVARRRRPALVGTKRIAHVFATRYDAVDRELPALLAREKPDIVVMFGVATRARQMRIEERARNRVSTLFPDAGGYRPAARTIAANAGPLRNPLPLARLVKAARSTGVAAVRSRNAGTYLCNYVYWRALEAAAAPNGPGLVIFVHVPPVGVKRRPKQRRNGKRRAAATLTDLVHAGEAVVLAMNALAATRR